MSAPSAAAAPAARGNDSARAEICIAVILFAVSTWLGTAAVRAFRAGGGVQEFYQSEFGPAVMMACGLGFDNPDATGVPALRAFLARASDAFDCASLPRPVATLPLTPFQASSVYLQRAVAITWKAAGIGWSRLAVLSGALFGLVVALTYGILRLALRRTLALVLLVPAIAWPPNLTLAPQLRDYAKGPFLLALILVTGAIVVGSGGRRVLLWSAAAGVLLGVGLGFRTDLMIAIAPVGAAIAFLSPPEVTVGRRLAAIAVFAASLVAVGLPALRGYARGGNTGHVALLGLSSEFDRTLRVAPSIYELLGPYNDTLAFSVINGFAAREGTPAGAALSTADYDRFATAYLRRIAATFPADVAVRMIAAVLVVPRYVLDSSLGPPEFVRASPARWLYRLRGSLSARLAPLAVPAVFAATMLIAIGNPRAAWLVVLVLATFVGASALQFHERHFYYLQFVPWLAFGVIVEALLRRRGVLAEFGGARARHAALAGAALLLVPVAALALARSAQQQAAGRLFGRYASAARTPLVTRTESGPVRTRFAAAEWAEPIAPGAPRVVSRFIGVQFDDARCGGRTVDLTARYESRYRDADLTDTRRIPLVAMATSQTTAFVVAYDRADESIRFRGVEVPSDRADCVAGIFRVDGLDAEPLLLNTTLAAGWRDARLYQRLQ